MFVYSFKASSVKIIGLICVCLLAAVAVISLMPDAGSALNVNKFDFSKELSKIDVKSEAGRIEYLSFLGYDVESDTEECESETLPKAFDEVTEKYNKLQRSQGFDLTKYRGKKVAGYTYEVSCPDASYGTDEDRYLATLLIYKNKVIGADLCNVSKGLVKPLVKTA